MSTAGPCSEQRDRLFMYGMPLSQALVFVLAVILIIGTTQRRYLHPFVAIVVVAAAFGYVAGFTTSVLTQNFGGGFAAMMYSPGLVIVAAGFISGLAETTMGSARLAAKLAGWQKRRPWLSSGKIEYVRTAGGSVRIFVDTLWRDPHRSDRPTADSYTAENSRR